MTRAEWLAMDPKDRDALVATAIMGWTVPPAHWKVDNDFWYKGGDPSDVRSFVWMDATRFTTNIAAAWLVVEAMRDRHDGHRHTLRITAYPYNRTYAIFGYHEDDPDWSEANGPHSTPEAICLAALVATGVIQ